MSGPEGGGAVAGGGARGLRGLLAALDGATVVVVGDAMLDRYLRGSTERISPEAPVPVVRLDGREAAPGGAANVASGIAALGAEARLVAAAGRDDAGDALVELLGRRGVEAGGLVRVEGRPTTTKTRVLSRGQQLLRVDRERRSALGTEEAEGLAAALGERLRGADALAVADYGKGTLGGGLARRAVEAARRRDLPVVVDPSTDRLVEYRGATVLKPNRPEAAAAAGRPEPPSSDGELEALRRRLEVENLLVTLGGEGMRLARADGDALRIPGRRTEVFDVTGAGDTVTAVLAAVVPAGEVPAAARLANRAAALAVQSVGARPVSRARLERALDSERKSSNQ